MKTECKNWLQYLNNLRQLSEATRRAYNSDLESWCEFLLDSSVEIQEAGLSEGRIFVSRLSRSGLASSTINRKISCLRNFYNWLHREDTKVMNPFEEIKSIKKQKKLPSCFSYEEIESILKVMPNSFAGIRDRALFELIYSTGCRVSEICSLNRNDLKVKHLKVSGKGRKERIVFTGRQAALALKNYTSHIDELYDSDNQKALFIDVRGHRLTARGVYYLINRYARAAGIERNVGPHTFRHSFATHILNEGAGIRTVQELLGHSSISTTQIYTHTGLERIKQIYREAHPHGRMKVRGVNTHE